MDQPTAERDPFTVKTGDVIVRHPQTDQPGRWNVAGSPSRECGRHVTIPYTAADGDEGRFVVFAEEAVTVEITEREQYQMCVKALAALAEETALPLENWSIVRDAWVTLAYQQTALAAHISGPDAASRMEFWANKFGAEVKRAEQTVGWRDLRVQATYMGVPVKLSATFSIEQVADEQAVA